MHESRSQAGWLSNGHAWGWLVLATALLCVSNGRWIVPAAAWLSPVFMLRFVRTRRAAVGIGAGLLASILVTALIWRGLVPVHGPGYFGVTASIAVFAFVPYVVDRWITPRLEGFASTLVLPMAWAAIDLLTARTSPFGSWGSVAYTQSENLPLLQLASVAGLPGVAFIVAWFASVANWAWERRFEWSPIRAGTLGYASVMAFALLAGGARLALAPPTARTVRLASFSLKVAHPPEFWRALQGPLPEAQEQTIRREGWALLDTLLERTRREARAGARMVIWSEGSAACFKQDEPELIARAAECARREGIHLFAALVTYTPGRPLEENQLLAFDPTGRLAFRYHKARPVPGDPETGADHELPVLATSFGRVGGAICFDMDFPDLIRQHGLAAVDLVVVPSSDWKDIDPVHTRMALVRGVENGCSIVRQTAKGLSAAADYEGRVLATTDFFKTDDPVMAAQVPTRGVRTVYARVGDLFAWLCVVGLLLAAAMAVRRTPRRSLSRGPTPG